jgi:hypothetical protein
MPAKRSASAKWLRAGAIQIIVYFAGYFPLLGLGRAGVLDADIEIFCWFLLVLVFGVGGAFSLIVGLFLRLFATDTDVNDPTVQETVQEPTHSPLPVAMAPGGDSVEAGCKSEVSQLPAADATSTSSAQNATHFPRPAAIVPAGGPVEAGCKPEVSQWPIADPASRRLQQDYSFWKFALIIGIFPVWPVAILSIGVAGGGHWSVWLALVPASLALPLAIGCLVAAYKRRKTSRARAITALKVPFYYAYACFGFWLGIGLIWRIWKSTWV